MIRSKLVQHSWRRSRWLQTPALLGVGSLAYLIRESDNNDASTPVTHTVKMLNRPSMQLPFPRILQPNHVECENPIGRMLERRRTLRRLDEGRDKRRLESVYSVDWGNPLGEGGFGAVYPAVEKLTKKKVAVKVISKKYTNDDGFRREMEALMQIRRLGGHPNLCGLHENFDEGGKFYLTLDHISGGEMFDHLIKSGVSNCADIATDWILLCRLTFTFPNRSQGVLRG